MKQRPRTGAPGTTEGADAGDEAAAEGSAACDGEPHAPAGPSEYSLDAFRRAATLFRALGDVERLKLLDALARREVCVTELAEASGARMPTVSQRLRVLRADGLVVQRRDGKHVFYALADEHVVELVRNALQHASETHGHVRRRREADEHAAEDVDAAGDAEEPGRPPQGGMEAAGAPPALAIAAPRRPR